MPVNVLNLCVLFFLSVVLYQAIFSLWQYFANKQIEYIFYAMYLAIIVFNFSQNFIENSLMNFLRINNFYIIKFVGLPINFLVNSFYMLFFITYFKAYNFDKKLSKQFNIFLTLNFLAFVVTFIISLSCNKIPFLAERVIQLFTLLFVLYPLIVLWKKKLPNSFFILIGSTALGIGFLVSVLIAIYNDIYSKHVSTDFLAAMGSFVEVLFFNYALQYKARLQEKELLFAKIEQQQILYEEHRRLSIDLHDEIGSNLSSIQILNTVLNKSLDLQEEKTNKIILQIKELIASAQESLGDIVWGLKPDSNNTYDLVIKFNNVIQHTLEPAQINTIVQDKVAINKYTLVGLHKSNLLLIFKECVNNILKHARAKNVKIIIELSNNNLILTITDDGVGFDIEKQLQSKNGNGLNNMKTRIENINGSMQLKSILNIGTSYVFTMPIS